MKFVFDQHLYAGPFLIKVDMFILEHGNVFNPKDVE